MNPTEATPRINSRFVPQYIGAVVRLVGRIDNLDYAQGMAYISASDGGHVRIKMNPESIERQAYNGHKIVEVIGKVNADQSLGELAMVPFEDKFGTSLIV
jgi:hypothetical protein